MFNYVVKDPDSSGLSREFWIKDQAGALHKEGLPRVLELDCACVCVDWLLAAAYSGPNSTRLQLAQQLVTF